MLLPTCFESVVVPCEIQAVSRRQDQIQYLIQRSKRESFVSLVSKRGSFVSIFLIVSFFISELSNRNMVTSESNREVFQLVGLLKKTCIVSFLFVKVILKSI